jgi:hypothetical protein
MTVPKRIRQSLNGWSIQTVAGTLIGGILLLVFTMVIRQVRDNTQLLIRHEHRLEMLEKINIKAEARAEALEKKQ